MSGPGADAPAAEGPRWDQLARAAARGDARDAESGGAVDVRQLLVFELAGSPYAVPVEAVREIVRMRPISPVPRVPEDVRGVISLRGEIFQVVDLRRRLGLPAPEAGRFTRIVVVQGGEGNDGEERGATGLLVDAVREVMRVREEAIRPAGSGDPATVEAMCVRGGGEFVSLLDLNRVFEIHGQS